MPEVSHRSAHVGPEQPASLDDWIVEVGGLVERPLRVSRDELADMAERVHMTSQVSCPDGIGTAGATFEGVPLAVLLDRAGIQPGAKYACIHSGGFTAAFTIESLGRRESILATRKNGALLDWSDGGPVRLVVAKGACFDAVKWVQRVTVEADASSATALAIVKARRPKLSPS